MSQFKFRKSVSLIFIGLCLVTGQVWGESINVPEEESSRLYLQWLDHFWTGLETSEVTQFRAASAVRLIQTDDPVAQTRGVKLLEDILKSSTLDAVSLWTIASACSWAESAQWCETGEAHQKLEQADAGNAAVLLLKFSQIQAKQGGDLTESTTHRDLFAQAAKADRFDSYWGRGAFGFYQQTLSFIEANPPPPGMAEAMSPGRRPATTVEQFALGVFLSLTLYTPSASYQSIFSFCQQQTSDQNTESMAVCKKLAHIMRNNGYESLTRSIGYAIDREMLRVIDPEDAGIVSWELRKQVFEIMMHCYLSPWQSNSDIQAEMGDATILNWLKNLDERGEWEGNRFSSRQEYEIAPEHFRFDPKKCDRLQQLDNENIITLLDGQSPDEAWQKIKDEG